MDSQTNEPKSIDIFLLDTRTVRWRRVKTQKKDDEPYMRYGHAVVTHSHHIYLWGGRNDTQGSCNKMWRFDGRSHSWKLIETSGDEPSGRDGHSMTVWKNKIVIFAGYDSDSECYSNETHYFDIATAQWSKIIPTQGIPARWRDFHTAAEIDDRLYIFGGRADIFGHLQSNQDYYCNQVKYLDLKTESWHDVPKHPHEPPGRRSHACFVYDNKMFIFGGFNAREMKHYNDMWCFEPTTNKWTQLDGYGYRPSARRRHTAVCIGSRVYISGGTSPVSDDLGGEFEMASKEENLQDHDQTIIVELEPKLNTLCMIKILNAHAKFDLSQLPDHLRREISNLSEPNQLSSERQNG